MAILLEASLYCYRFLSHTKKVVFYCYLTANFSVIVLFYCARFYMIQHSGYTMTNLIIFLYFIIFSLSTLLLISRLFFRIGYIIDNDANILLTVEHVIKSSVGFFGNVGRRMVGAMPPTPGNGGVDRHFALGLVTCGATVVGVGFGGCMAYDSRKSRIATEIGAKAAVDAANYAKFSGEREDLWRRRGAGDIDSVTFHQEMEKLKKKHGMD